MKKLIVLSEKEELCRNVEPLVEHLDVFVSKDAITELKDLPDADLYIVLSPHRSASNLPCLTVHAPGNWGRAELGGVSRKLSIAPALYMRSALLSLMENPVEGFEISYEVTHHGPSLNKPIFFIEVGSTSKEWNNKQALEAIAKVAEKVFLSEPESKTVAVGFGGSHYAPKFTKLAKDFAFGHMCPKYACDFVDFELFKQAIEKTYPEPELVLIDWKGLKGNQRRKIIAFAESFGIEWRKI